MSRESGPSPVQVLPPRIVLTQRCCSGVAVFFNVCLFSFRSIGFRSSKPSKIRIKKGGGLSRCRLPLPIVTAQRSCFKRWLRHGSKRKAATHAVAGNEVCVAMEGVDLTRRQRKVSTSIKLNLCSRPKKSLHIFN
jgi:hypothetical protein